MFVAVIMLTLTSCTERVYPGYKGMVQRPSGLTGEVLEPGNHSCWGRDKLVLIENAETNYISKMDVLCKDELNFKFDVNVLARLKNGEVKDFDKQVANIIDRQGGKIEWSGISGKLDFDVLYKTYIKPKVDAISRSVVSKYETTQIRENRDIIEKEITKRVIKASKSTPVEIVTVVTSNFDYPDVITTAQESKKEREIKLEEEDAIQALELKRIKNRNIVAEKEILVKAKEARAEAAYINILGRALTPRYLKLKEIQNQEKLYSKKIVTHIVPEGTTPFISN